MYVESLESGKYESGKKLFVRSFILFLDSVSNSY